MKADMARQGGAAAPEAAPADTADMRGALASLSLSVLLSSLGISIANVALPTLTLAFGATFQQVQWIVIAYLLAITTLIVSVGRLGDLVGRRRLLLVGIGVFTGASLVCGGAPGLGLLIAARAAQGLGAAIMMALTLAFVGETVPKERTGSAIGLLGTMSAVGTALGPSLGGVLIAGLGWRAIFFINLPLGLFALWLAGRHLPRDQVANAAPGGLAAGRARFDLPGTLLLALTLAAYALAMTLGRGHFGALNSGLLVAAAVGAALFVRVQERSPSPLIRLALFRERVLSGSLVMSLLVSTVMMATLVVGPFYLALALGLEAKWVGLTMSVGPLVAALTAAPAGRVADRFGARPMTILGLGGLVAGATILSLLPMAAGIPGYLGPLVVMTFSYSVFQTANNTAVMADVASDLRGAVSGLLNLSRNLGLVTGASLMGAVFALASATSDLIESDPQAIATGMRVTFAVSALLALAALFIATAVGRDARGDGALGQQPKPVRPPSPGTGA